MTIAHYTPATKSHINDNAIRHDVFRYGRLVGGVYKLQEQPLQYRAVQRLCKAHGLSAKGSLVELRKRLWDAEYGTAQPAPVPTTRKQRANTQPAHQSFDFDAAYAFDAPCYECPVESDTTNIAPQPEQPQAIPAPEPTPIVSEAVAMRDDARATVRAAHQPATYREMQRLIKWFCENDYYVPSRKNVGMANVQANVDELMDTQRFWDILNHERYGEAIAQFTAREW